MMTNPQDITANELDSRLPAKRRLSTSRRWCGAIGVSTALHLVAIAVLAGWWSIAEQRFSPDYVESDWTEPLVQQAIEPDAMIDTLTPTFVTASRQQQPAFAADSSSTSCPVKVKVPLPFDSSSERPPIVENSQADDNLAAVVGVPGQSGSESTDGLSKGSGEANSGVTGIGETPGGGFFGVQAVGNRVVYVVDSSRSMNHPHESIAKTRFGRVKLEIAYSIRRMNSEMEFFIIFFNNNAVPMPSRKLQPALPAPKKHYLTWMANVKTGGQTDPRDALRVALLLRPDMIYFLTDGEFRSSVVRDVTKLNRFRRTPIHTFGLGNRSGEPMLKIIAERNGGTYRFVP
jgi:hypothetical protein